MRWDTTVRAYDVRLSAASWAVSTTARMESARLWKRLVRLHARIRQRGAREAERRSAEQGRHWRWPTEAELKAHFKRRFALHSESVQFIIERFCETVSETAARRRAGDRSAVYPHRQQRYRNVTWKQHAIRHLIHSDGSATVILSTGQGRAPLRAHLPEWPDGEVVQAELSFARIALTIRRQVPATVNPPGDRTAAIDLGLIHLAVVTDGQDSLAVVGRGLRSVKQGHAKAIAELASLQAHCSKGSRRWRKLQRAKKRRRRQVQNRARHLLHQAANAVIGWAAWRQVGTLVYGETDINRYMSGQRRRQVNQQMGTLELGRFVQYLAYKGRRVGIAVCQDDESWTTQTCPVCGALNTPRGRTYRCRGCSFEGVRDEVGAANFLNRHLNGSIVPGAIVPRGHVTYRRPAPVRGCRRRRSAADTGHPAVTLGVASPDLPSGFGSPDTAGMASARIPPL